jgi:hypothetical protein
MYNLGLCDPTHLMVSNKEDLLCEQATLVSPSLVWASEGTVKLTRMETWCHFESFTYTFCPDPNPRHALQLAPLCRGGS